MPACPADGDLAAHRHTALAAARHPGPLINRSTGDVRALTAEAETDDQIGDQDRHSKGDPNRRDHMPKTQLHAPGTTAARNQHKRRM